MIPHLSDHQLDDLLIGDANPDTTAHLDACTACAARFAAAKAPMASFDAVSLAWGQRRSATLPSQLPARAGLSSSGRLRVAMGATVAAIFALALAMPLLHHDSATQTAHRNVAPLSTAPQTVPRAESPALPLTQDQQIARDNQLLQAIDRELATSETPADLLKAAGPQDSDQTSPDTPRNN